MKYLSIIKSLKNFYFFLLIIALAVVYLLNLYKILFLLFYKVIDAVSNGIIMPVTKPSSIVVLVSTSNITSLRFIRS